MKILYLYRGVPVGTPLVHIRFTIDSLRALGHEVVECFPVLRGRHDAHDADRTPLARAKGWYRAVMPRPLVNLAQLYEARHARAFTLAMCRQERPDLIYERYSIFTDAGLLAARAAGCPLVQEVNAVYSSHHAEIFGPGFRARAQRADRLLLPQADALVAVSEEVSRGLVAFGVPREKITVVHNAVDPTEFAGVAQQREARRRALGLADACVVLVLQALDNDLFATWLLRAMREAWPRLRAAVPNARLLWIGGGSRCDWFQQHLRAEVPGCAQEALLLGRQPHADVPALLACGDVGLVPWHRTFCSPMKLFEYMAAELPVVAPRLEGVSEVISDGDNGLLFAPQDFAAMAKQVIGLAQDRPRAAALAQRGRNCVLREHTWERNAARIIEIAERVLEAKRTSAEVAGS